MLSSSYDYNRNDYYFLRVSELPLSFESIGKMKSWVPNWIVNLFV